jgi:hypothetical protein
LIVSDQSNYNSEDAVTNLNFRNTKYITVDLILTIDERIVTSQYYTVEVAKSYFNPILFMASATTHCRIL